MGAIDVHDRAAYAQYRACALPLIAALSDVELLSRDDHPMLFEGAIPADHLFILKFPSLDRVKAFIESEEYGRCIPLRHVAATTRYVMAMRGTDEGGAAIVGT
nr:DUF1330 domain-containing protein [Sphingobium sp. Sx8-8]